MPPIRKNVAKKTNIKKIKIKGYNIQLKEKTLNIVEINNILNRKKINNLPVIFNEIKTMAKNNGYKKIIGETWIFAEHSKISNKLNIKINKNSILSFNKIKKENNIVKIIGINKTFMKTSKFIPLNKVTSKILSLNKKTNFSQYVNNTGYLTLFDCIVQTETGLKKKSLYLPSNSMLLKFEINL